MRVFPAVALATLALFVVPSPSRGQSLAEAAAKEKERRKAAQKGKSFTDDDLRSGGGGSVSSTPDAAADGAAAKPNEAAKGKEKPKTEDEVRAEQNDAWRKKMDAANKKVGVLQDTVNKIQLDLNDMSGGVYSARRATLLTLLEDTKKQLADAQQSVSDLEGEGRRSSYH